MEHNKFKEMLILYSYNELGKEEQKEFERHLLDCASCKNELEELLKLHQVIKNSFSEEVDEDTLFESRHELLAGIRILNRKKVSPQKIWEFLTTPTTESLRFSYSIAATVLIFVTAYFLLFNSVEVMKTPNDNSSIGELNVSNLQIINKDDENGEVEISFEQTVPVKLKGNINDIEIQQVLAKSLLNSENPGIRLQTVSAIYSEKRESTTEVLKNALLNAMMYDNNPGVRKVAMNALCLIPFDNEVRDAMIYVLQNDKNSGLRIQAINCLSEKNDLKQFSDPNTINALKERMNEDENSYIKIQAKTILTKISS
ncbi:MAG: HEAT repeat domain-containing protein [Ignavibacteria bacterium]|nr:HEAT repeat domain-containing protein [Ignavibacteria bacterium]